MATSKLEDHQALSQGANVRSALWATAESITLRLRVKTSGRDRLNNNPKKSSHNVSDDHLGR